MALVARLRVAEERGCSYVVFRLTDAGSIGEDQGDLQSLFDRMQASPVATVAVLRGRVTQGAAALALVADQAFCLAGVAWGEVEDQARELEDWHREQARERAENRQLEVEQARERRAKEEEERKAREEAERKRKEEEEAKGKKKKKKGKKKK